MARESKLKPDAKDDSPTQLLHDGLIARGPLKLMFDNLITYGPLKLIFSNTEGWSKIGFETVFWANQLQLSKRIVPIVARYLGEESPVTQFVTAIPNKPQSAPTGLSTTFPKTNGKMATVVMPALFMAATACTHELMFGIAERAGFNPSSSFLQVAVNVVGTCLSGKVVSSAFERGSTLLLAYKASQNPALHYELAKRHFARGDYKKAEAAFLKMPKVSVHYQSRLNKDHLKHFGLGQVYLKLGDDEKALTAFCQASDAAVKEFLGDSIPETKEFGRIDRYQFLMHYNAIKKTDVAISEEAETFAQAEFEKEKLSLAVAEQFVAQMSQTTLYKNPQEITALIDCYQDVKGPTHFSEEAVRLQQQYELYKANHVNVQGILINLICFHKNVEVGQKAAELFKQFFSEAKENNARAYYQFACALKDKNPLLAHVYFFMAATASKAEAHQAIELLKIVDNAFELLAKNKLGMPLDLNKLLLLVNQLQIKLDDLPSFKDSKDDQSTIQVKKIHIIIQKLETKKEALTATLSTHYRSHYEMGEILLNANVSSEHVSFVRSKARPYFQEAAKAPQQVSHIGNLARAELEKSQTSSNTTAAANTGSAGANLAGDSKATPTKNI